MIAAGVAAALMGTAALAAAPVAGSGTVTCSFVGKAKIKPALIIGGTLTPVTTKLKGKLTCTAGTADGATIASGKVKGVITNTAADANDCLGLATSGLPAFDADVKWKVTPGSPKLSNTTVNFAATPPGNINLAGPGGSIQLTLNGVGAAGGSFAGNPIVAVATTDQTLSDFTTACTPPSKGLKQFTFTGVNGTSTLSVN